MIIALWIVLFLLLITIFAYNRASLSVFSIAVAIFLVLLSLFNHQHLGFLSACWLMFILVFGSLNVSFIRRQFLTRPVLAVYRRIMPRMSDTERQALSAGDVGWTSELFSGMPNWELFASYKAPDLPEEEIAFLNGPVEKLCSMIDSWKISRSMLIPDEIWDLLKQEKFFGMIIPKCYGGLEFSAMGHSSVIVKVASMSAAVASVVSVPNSLGPAELLLRYGTEEQKNYYLPRLATGEEIPCFALTSPVAGSDAASIQDHGVVCKATIDGKEQLAIRLNWNKRYITLCPVATILGLAFKLYDPDHLLGDKDAIGITCALIPVSTPGVVTGHRHYPLDSAFPNGPTQGNDVLIPVDWVIGGRQQAGRGWLMLMECLAAGRGISLPSMAIGGAKRIALATGAYTRYRRQFNTAIGNFEGVSAALSRVVAKTYAAVMMRHFMMSALDDGRNPVVASAIIKSNATQLAREVIIDAMDIHGGKGICMGPNNYMAQYYIESPISITVEGANILTRSMIIFGQGVIRCHPFTLKEMLAAANTDTNKGLLDFDKAFFGHVGFFISNIVRSFLLGLSNSHLARHKSSPLRRYYKQVSRFSAILGCVSDTLMLVLGAKLKFKERLSARLADILSYLYLVTTAIKFYEASITSDQQDEIAVVQWVCEEYLYRTQQQLHVLLSNLPVPVVGGLLKLVTLPLGRRLRPPSDTLSSKVAEFAEKPGAVRQRLAEYIYITPTENNPVGAMHENLQVILDAEPILARLSKAEYHHKIQGTTWPELIKSAKENSIISAEEYEQLIAVNDIRMQFVNVDDFPFNDIVREW